jgi:hypothetical protein
MDEIIADVETEALDSKHNTCERDWFQIVILWSLWYYTLILGSKKVGSESE